MSNAAGCRDVLVARGAYRMGARAAYSIIEVTSPTGPCDRSVIEKLTTEFTRQIGNLDSLAGDHRIRSYRRLFWSMKVDPTKTRPSHEALARRLLRSGRMPTVNCLVDVANAVSLRTLVSIGLYDLDKLQLPVVVEVAGEGAYFNPIGGGSKPVAPGLIVARDAAGRIIHLYAHRDSRDTMVTDGTRRVLAVAYGTPEVGEDYLADALRLLERSLREAGILESSTEPCRAGTV